MRPTNNEQESKGEWMGFEGRTAVIPLSVSFVGLFAGSILFTFLQFSPLPTFAVCLAPGAIAAVITLLFVNNKPPGYLPDLVRTICARAGHSHFRSPKVSPYKDK